MMLRERLQIFLVVSLLVSVTSDQSRPCFICGDGYEVGSPSARTGVPCPNLTSCTCEELALAGLQGSIPIEQCSNVSTAIFTTCDCQEDTPQDTTHDTWFPSVSPVAPHYNAAPSFSSITQTGAPSESNEKYFFALLSSVLLLFVITGCISNADYLCRPCCIYCMPSSRIDETQQNVQTLPRPNLDAIREALSRSPHDPIGQALSRRHLVLAALFPKEGKLEGDEHTDAHSNLKYDPQSKHSIFSEDAPDAVSCSICMEFLVPTDDAVTGLCSHAYHRECILHWLQGGHDDCPNCRRPMWDPETYEMVDECIKNGDCFSPFAV